MSIIGELTPVGNKHTSITVGARVDKLARLRMDHSSSNSSNGHLDPLSNKSTRFSSSSSGVVGEGSLGATYDFLEKDQQMLLDEKVSHERRLKRKLDLLAGDFRNVERDARKEAFVSFCADEGIEAHGDDLYDADALNDEMKMDAYKTFLDDQLNARTRVTVSRRK